MKAPRKSRPSKQGATAVIVALRIQPRASKNSITRLEDGSFKVRLTAPPVDGAANEALIAILADALHISKSAIEIVSGHTARDKRISLAGMSLEQVNRLLNKEKERGNI